MKPNTFLFLFKQTREEVLLRGLFFILFLYLLGLIEVSFSQATTDGLNLPPLPSSIDSQPQPKGLSPESTPPPTNPANKSNLAQEQTEQLLPSAPRLTPPTPPQAPPEEEHPVEQAEKPVPQAIPIKKKPKKIVGPPSGAEGQKKGPTVKEIEIVYVGPKSVNRSMILSNMRTTVGQPYSATTIEEDVRNLYATGLFTNLRITTETVAEGVKVIVIVQPKPLVKEVTIQGAKQIPVERIRKQVKTKIGDPLSEFQVSADAEKIREYYQNHGFSNAQVTYKIDVNEEFGRAIVSFSISEGEKQFIVMVNFIGNKAFSNAELQKQLKTKKKNLLSFVNKSGILKEDQLQEDLRKLKEFYQDHGYIDMQIKDVKISTPEKEKMVVTISIFEGIQYKVGTIQFQGNVIYPNSDLLDSIKMKEGSVFSPKGLDDDIKAIRDLYGKQGYIDAEIKPERLANIENGRIDLLFKISEGSQAYIDKIIIQGNNQTKDKVIRRELAVTPGDVYDSVRVEASKKRLENLGYFEKVEINPQDTNVPNRKNMVISVQEKRTGNVTFGLGYSTIESLLGFVELNQGNFDIANPPSFTGAGQKFRFRLQLGIFMESAMLSFTEPWFMDQPLMVGFDLFFNQLTYLQFYNGFNETQYGLDLRLAKRLNQWFTLSTRYDFNVYDLWGYLPEVENIPVFAQNRGSRTQSDITMDLIYDSRDSVFVTRHGTFLDFNILGAGGPLLGQTDIYRLQLDISHFENFPLWDIIMWNHLTTGFVQQYGKSSFVPLFDSYFVGGPRSLRGFDYNLVGPNYLPLDFPIGGQTMAVWNLEFTFPVVDRVRFAVFNDMGFNAGSLIGPNQYVPTPFVAGQGINIDADYGFGLRLFLPIGPLRLDYGIPYLRQSWLNKTGRFYFDVGYSF